MRSYRMNLGVFFLIASVVGCVQNHYPSDPFVGSPLTEGPRVVPGQPVENIDELTTETFTEDDLSHHPAQPIEGARFWTADPNESVTTTYADPPLAQNEGSMGYDPTSMDAAVDSDRHAMVNPGPVTPSSFTVPPSVVSRAMATPGSDVPASEVYGNVPDRLPSEGRTRRAFDSAHIQPKYSESRVPVRSDRTFAHEPSYRWLAGSLDYVAMDGKWQIRYAPYSVEDDKYGGSLYLQEDPRFENFSPGDLVTVEGELIPVNTKVLNDDAVYRVRSIRKR